MKIFKRMSLALSIALMAFVFVACGKTEKELVLSADKTTALRGEVVTLTAVWEDDDDKIYSVENATFEITSGESFATLEQNELTINNDATPNSKIEVVAKLDGKTSNKVEITVSVPLDAITISAGGKTNIISGGFVALTKTLNPEVSDVSIDDVQWEIIQGSNICFISNDILYVNDSVETGEQIKIKAKSGAIESNILTFTVGYPLQSITASIIGSSNIENNNSRAISTTISPSNATNVNIRWQFIQGEDLCSIVNNLITIDEDAATGSIIKFKAVSGTIESDTITVVVGTPIETITINAYGIQNGTIKNSTTLLNVSVTPAKASISAIEWEVTEGSDYAEVINGNLIVDDTTPVGTTIKVKATSGSVESNELTFTYGVPVSSVSISAGSTEIVKGNTIALSATVLPEDATNKTVVWEVTEGSEYAEIVSNSLTIKSTAVTNATVKVKATVGGVESNELTFTVMPTQQEINATKYFISVNKDELKLDKNSKSALPVLKVAVYNLNFQQITDQEITYTIVEGEEYLDVTPNGYNCEFEILGHGTAVVEVGIVGSPVTKQVEIDVVVPPEVIQLPGVFTERTGYAYNFSKINPKTLVAEQLPFVATALGTNVCTDIEYTFEHKDGTTGAEVAVYEDGKITFNKTGEIKVIATSNSGSENETSISYTFNINEGYNVYTFAQLQVLANRNDYCGQEINIVVLEKPDGSANNYEYGYDLVSDTALKAKSEQTFADIYRGTTAGVDGQRINFVYKSVHINGNKHKINLSQLRQITKDELDTKHASGECSTAWNDISSVLTIIPWNRENDLTRGGMYDVKIYDLEMIGNCSINYSDDDVTDKNVYGVTSTGIAIGGATCNTLYTVDMKNVTVSGFGKGIKFAKVVPKVGQNIREESVAENIYVYNCYSNGVETQASIMTFRNLKFGSCGAVGIELAPVESNKSGINENENQTITFEGELQLVDGSFNNGETAYFNKFKINGYTIPQIVQGQLVGYDQTQISHLIKDGQMGFVSFVLVDMTTFSTNTSVVQYASFQDGGIIKSTDLPTNGNEVNTTCQYIELEVDLSAFGLGKAGKVLMYNHNYISK